MIETPIDRWRCDDVFARIDDYLDRALSEAETEAVRRHLEQCAACAAEYSFESRVLDDLREKLRRVRAPERLLDNIISNLAKENPNARS